MKVITFYSYKGGVGRTLAAVNFAMYLAKIGQKTVLIDFDLDAPGCDSKILGVDLSDDQQGVLDYILEYQEMKADPKSIKQICIPIPMKSEKDDTLLWLIPAGNYLSSEYYRKLRLLDWQIIFSKEYGGVEFFQRFLARIKAELEPDFVIVDSRTGISEVAGLCTQQLADEVVMLSSLSSEGMKMTKHIKQLILDSQIAVELEKSIDVKIVVSRVPKADDLSGFKERCCDLFEIDGSKMFFIFSCPVLEQEEFLAIASTEKDDELVSNYLKLFHGLNIDLASDVIRGEIARTSQGLLSVSPEESEKMVLELAALYPHPEVYLAAMRFFYLQGKTTEVNTFASRVLDLAPNDEEAQGRLAEFYLRILRKQGISYLSMASQREEALRVLGAIWQRKELEPEDRLYYAQLLESVEEYSKSFEIASTVLLEEQLGGSEIIDRAREIAARSALGLGELHIAMEVFGEIPLEDLSGVLAKVAFEVYVLSGGLDAAFTIAVSILRASADESILKGALDLAKGLDRVEELAEAIKTYWSGINIYSAKSERRSFIEALVRLEWHSLAEEL